MNSLTSRNNWRLKSVEIELYWIKSPTFHRRSRFASRSFFVFGSVHSLMLPKLGSYVWNAAREIGKSPMSLPSWLNFSFSRSPKKDSSISGYHSAFYSLSANPGPDKWAFQTTKLLLTTQGKWRRVDGGAWRRRAKIIKATYWVGLGLFCDQAKAESNQMVRVRCSRTERLLVTHTTGDA